MKTIYNTYVEMQSQEQCDRMKQLCLDNDLLIDELNTDFLFNERYKYFMSSVSSFYIASWDLGYTKVTEQEFIELLKNK